MGLDIYLYPFDAEKYRTVVEPQIMRFFATSDPFGLTPLLHEALEASTDGSFACSRALLQSSLNILNGSEFYGPPLHVKPFPTAQTSREDLAYYVRYTVAGQLLECLCIPKIHGRVMEQNMTRSALIPFLYEHSQWIENAFTGGLLDSGPRLEFPLGEHSEIIHRDTVLRLVSEIEQIPAPQSPIIQSEFSELKHLLQIVLKEPHLELLLSMI